MNRNIVGKNGIILFDTGSWQYPTRKIERKELVAYEAGWGIQKEQRNSISKYIFGFLKKFWRKNEWKIFFRG